LTAKDSCFSGPESCLLCVQVQPQQDIGNKSKLVASGGVAPCGDVKRHNSIDPTKDVNSGHHQHFLHSHKRLLLLDAAARRRSGGAFRSRTANPSVGGAPVPIGPSARLPHQRPPVIRLPKTISMLIQTDWRGRAGPSRVISIVCAYCGTVGCDVTFLFG